MAAKTEEKNLMEKKGTYHYASGKRKTSIARVRLYEGGKGEIVINNQDIKDYLYGTLIGSVKSPLKLTDNLKRFDITIKVVGGGKSSQADAARHGISRALVALDPDLRGTLKAAGLLTRDSRIKERKKYGLRGARRAPQFSKR